MRLNHDCVRALLLYLEDHLDVYDELYVKTIDLPKYSIDDVIYTAKKLKEAGYITYTSLSADDETEIYITGITWEGHTFLDSIRDNEVWRKTKGFIAKFASVSLSFTADVASQVIATMLSQYLNHPQHQP